MKIRLHTLAVLLLLVAAAVIFSKRSASESDAARIDGSPGARAIASVPEDNRQDGEPGLRVRPRRQTLEEALPPGAEVVRFPGKDGGLQVTFADGSSITAAGASISDRGVAYRGPYKFKGEGAYMNSIGKDTYLFFSTDGKSMKAIGKTGMSNAPLRDGGDASFEIIADQGITINLPDTWKERGR